MFDIDEIAKAREEALEKERDEMDKFLCQKYFPKAPLCYVPSFAADDQKKYVRRYSDIQLDICIELKKLSERN